MSDHRMSRTDNSDEESNHTRVGPRRSRQTRSRIVGVAVAGGGLLAAACGSAATRSPSAAKATSTNPPPATAAAAATVHAAEVSPLGTVLVDSAGRTVYLLSAGQHKTVTCTASGGCTTYWPPLLDPGAEAPSAGPGVETSLLGTIKAPDGRIQVTYDHWPLYTFAGDSRAGQANGQGVHSFGGTWAALTVSGHAATSNPTGPTTTSKVYGY